MNKKRESTGLFNLATILLTLVIASFVYIYFSYKSLKEQNIKISEQRYEIDIQQETIRNLELKIEDYQILESENKQLKEECSLLASISPMSNLIEPEEIINKMNNIPSGSPFIVPVDVTARYGASEGLFNIVRYNHQGLDIVPGKDFIGNLDNWKIKSFSPGIVVSVGIDSVHGKNIIIEHNEGLRTRYSHLEKIFYTADVNKTVTSNTIIGIFGTSGRSSAAHLHFEILVNVNDMWIPINPEPFITNIQEYRD